jgi:undecaprenyl diphosphate synthase
MEDTPAVPTHLGIIMDGNGRWAQNRSLPRTAGHLEGLKALKKVLKEASSVGIGFVTFYVFSTENWKRSKQEVSYLMSLLVSKLHGELSFYNRNDIRILVRGDVGRLPPAVAKVVRETEAATAGNRGICCILAINYGGQDEICRAVNRCLAENDKRTVTCEEIRAHLDLPDIPPVDMIVRSANERRLSNFLLWDSAYAELGFYEKLWPDWNEEDVRRVCADFAGRVRKFGGIR